MNVLAKAQTMKITKMSKHIGAEVTGIDLTKPVDADTRRRLNEAAVEHIALVIRDQKFTHRQFLDAAMLFGEPMERYFTDYGVPGVPFVHEVSSLHRSKDGSVKKTGPKWHTDHTNQEFPPKYTILHAVSLPRAGGGTSVVNMRACYDALPDDMKQRVANLQTVNVMVGSAVDKFENTDSMMRQKAENPPPILQPLVRTNADNGTKALYFHPNKTENIVGMGPEESQALLDDLLERAIRPEFVYSHQHRLGDMFLWDNRSALHKANYDFDPTDTTQHRLLYRVLIQGERPR